MSSYFGTIFKRKKSNSFQSYLEESGEDDFVFVRSQNESVDIKQNDTPPTYESQTHSVFPEYPKHENIPYSMTPIQQTYSQDIPNPTSCSPLSMLTGVPFRLHKSLESKPCHSNVHLHALNLRKYDYHFTFEREILRSYVNIKYTQQNLSSYNAVDDLNLSKLNL